jgi:phage gp46-like protein
VTDVRHSWDPWGLTGDWVFDPAIGDLASGRDLETSVIISLFTDRLAHLDDRLPDPQDGDRRGWWADWDADEGEIGSRLWLVSREKETEEVRVRVEDYCREALAWILEDDVADTVEVSAVWNPQAPGRLDVDVTIMRARAVLLHRSYSWAWRQLYAV